MSESPMANCPKCGADIEPEELSEDVQGWIRAQLARQRHQQVVEGKLAAPELPGCGFSPFPFPGRHDDYEVCPICGADNWIHWHDFTCDEDRFPRPPESECASGMLTINYEYECGHNMRGVWPGIRAWVEKHGLDWADFEEDYGIREGDTDCSHVWSRG